MIRDVLVGQAWKRKDPSGAWVEFEVISTETHNPYGQKCVTGKTPGGKLLKANLTAMQTGDPRFEHVHDERVRKAG